MLQLIYDLSLYTDEFLPDFYTDTIKLELDIIRFCLSFVRNITLCMYQRFEGVFERLLSSLCNVFDYVRDSRENVDLRIALLDDVIRLCSESFDYFCVIDKDGLYNSFRDNFEERRISYSSERESDKMYADSIVMGYSHLTLSLYAKYAEFLCAWLMLCENATVLPMNRLLKQIHEEKYTERKQILECIESHYLRIVSGYENYLDIYSVSDKKNTILNFDIAAISQKRLSDNKRFSLRGFDGGTGRGSERFTERVMDEIINSQTPISTALTVLNPRYPLSDESYRLLMKKNFGEKLCENKNVSDLALRTLAETLVCEYNELSGEIFRKELYEHLITLIPERVTSTDAFLERMYHVVSSMYVREKLGNMETSYTLFCDKLYNEYCRNVSFKPVFCDDYIAEALYSQTHNEKVKINKALLEKALNTFCAENEISDKRNILRLFHILT